MTVTLPEWLVWLAVALWCARCSVEWLLAWSAYRREMELRRERKAPARWDVREAHRG